MRTVIKYISANLRIGIANDQDVLNAIVLNAINAYSEDNTIFDIVLEWYLSKIRISEIPICNIISVFFDNTNTSEKAFHKIWELKEDNCRYRSLAIAHLITAKLMEKILNQYNEQKLLKDEIIQVYLNISCIDAKKRDEFEKLVRENTDIVIKIEQYPDYDLIRKEKQMKNFNLLFDSDGFKQETLRIFEKYHKDVLSSEDILEIRIDNDREISIENSFSSSSLALLRDYTEIGKLVLKDAVINWFENIETQEFFRISKIYEYLNNIENIEITESQKDFIIKWCMENVLKVDFKNSIEVYQGGRTYTDMAFYIWYFSRRFNISYTKSILLDMLSFDIVADKRLSGIDYLSKYLSSDEIIERMLENIRAGIVDDTILENHIWFLTKHKIKESYSFILDELVNTTREYYIREKFLDIFVDNTGDFELLKTIIDTDDLFIKWKIIDKLKNNNEKQFLEGYLLNEIHKVIEPEEFGMAAEGLVSLQNIEGLKAYVSWIKENNPVKFDSDRLICLSSLKSKEAIPYLMELLEICYQKEIIEDRFSRFYSFVIGAINNIGLTSEENFRDVKSELGKFMKNNSDKEFVNGLIIIIEKLEEQFYLDNAPSFTIQEVKEKLSQLAPSLN